MTSDQEEDEILNHSAFADDLINKGDLVWAPLQQEDQCIMWPALVTSVNKKGNFTVKMLGRPMKVVTVSDCTPYCHNEEFEITAQSLEYWENAKSKLKQIMDKETIVIFQNSSASIIDDPSTKEPKCDRNRKRRKISHVMKNEGYAIGDIIWAKYRNHPTWPAKVHSIEKNNYFMIRYFQCDDVAIKTASKNISHFSCSEYTAYVEAGINSTLSDKFKVAYKEGYDEYAAQSLDSESVVPLIQIFSNGSLSEEVASPKKGKNQLVYFINKNTEMFQKIIQGKLVSHFHSDFMNGNSASSSGGGLFGSFAKTDLEEERVLEAIGLMQHKLSKKSKLPQAYGLNVMLPEAIIRFIMFKNNLTYSKAKVIYEADVKKVKRKDKISAREALLNAPVTQEAKDEFEKLSQLKTQKLIKELQKTSSGKTRCRKKL